MHRRKQCDVACAQVSLRPLAAADSQGANKARAQLGNSCRFRFALVLVACVPRNADCQLCCSSERQRRQRKGRSERYEAGLPLLSENVLKYAVDVRIISGRDLKFAVTASSQPFLVLPITDFASA